MGSVISFVGGGKNEKLINIPPMFISYQRVVPNLAAEGLGNYWILRGDWPLRGEGAGQFQNFGGAGP